MQVWISLYCQSIHSECVFNLHVVKKTTGTRYVGFKCSERSVASLLPSITFVDECSLGLN